MDISIRLYNMNSSLRSPLEDERPGHSNTPGSADDENCEEAIQAKEEDGVAFATASVVAQPEQTQPAEKVNVADFEAIFLRYQTPITNFIYHLIGNREQAYDLAQDVFVKAYRALLGGTVVQPGALSAWLYRIAANTTTDTLRRRRLISWLPLSLFNEDRGIGAGVVSDSGGASGEGFGSSGDDHAHDMRTSAMSVLHERGGYDGGRFESRVADREIVERVFRQLPPKYASCLWLYENDGHSCAEIAEVLQISPSAVKMRLMRARERFISLYNKEVGED
ncbi:MAG: RNA polymerase sigma factor [Chloroflexi bacterium]|nr:MAG: RNA polymerase sigma factor [Chloroflexota bacterium]